MTPVGKTTTTLNIMQGPLRGLHEIGQDLNLSNGFHGLLAAGPTSLQPHDPVGPKHLHEIPTNHNARRTRRGVEEKELGEGLEPTSTIGYGAYIMGIWFQGDTVKLNVALSVCLPGHGEAGLWSADENASVGG